MERRFRTVAVGGTFDEFHRGHRTLLLRAFEVGERVMVGLCSDDFVKKLHKPHKTASYERRLEDLRVFLREHDLLGRAEVVPLNTPFGVTLSKGCVEALVVSRETELMALEINDLRRDRGLSPLEIVVIDMVPSENHSAISTTRIRKGEIDREGHLLKTAH